MAVLVSAVSVPSAYDLSDAEVEDLHLSRRRDDDVAGLDVAMQDQTLVRVLDRRAHLTEQADALGQRQAALHAVGGDGRPLGQLHHEVALPAVHTAVQEPDDVRVLETLENLTLLDEAALGLRHEDPVARHLQGHLALQLAIGTRGPIHLAHAAAANLFQEPIRADGGAWRE